MNKSFIGASLVAGSVIVVTLATGFTNFRETRQAEFQNAQTQGEIKAVEKEVKPTATPSATPSATPTPTKAVIYKGVPVPVKK